MEPRQVSPGQDSPSSTTPLTVKLSQLPRPSRSRAAAANGRQANAGPSQLEGTKLFREGGSTPPTAKLQARTRCWEGWKQKLARATYVFLDWLARQRAEC